SLGGKAGPRRGSLQQMLTFEFRFFRSSLVAVARELYRSGVCPTWRRQPIVVVGQGPQGWASLSLRPAQSLAILSLEWVQIYRGAYRDGEAVRSGAVSGARRAAATFSDAS